jgi:4-amino-4-deoxy-L-arabinose transferase-like glycosyltransferase
VYYLARSPQAQPVAFAFGGEANPRDYARAMADGGLLAMIACLGLAQLSHETTGPGPAGFTALAFFGWRPRPGTPWRRARPGLGLAGLALSGAPAMAVLLGLGGAAVCLVASEQDAPARSRNRRWAAFIALATLAVALLAWGLDLYRWRVGLPTGAGRDWRSSRPAAAVVHLAGRPLALWTLWRWRHRLASRHVALPLWFAAVALATTLSTPSADRSLLLGLPALATLAAFALPTMQRSVAALIDWFTLLFFSGCALVIWVVWIAMQTGVPAKPAANVAKLAPGFEPTFSWPVLAVALAATLCWAWLVKWRAGRHRAAIWKSLVLPAGGAALCWLLLMTLWLPLLDFARSTSPKTMSPWAMRP